MNGGIAEAWQSFQVFVYMDGHGPYVWAVYLVAVVLLIVNYVKFQRDRRQTVQALRARHAARGRTQ